MSLMMRLDETTSLAIKKPFSLVEYCVVYDKIKKWDTAYRLKYMAFDFYCARFDALEKELKKLRKAYRNGKLCDRSHYEALKALF